MCYGESLSRHSECSYIYIIFRFRSFKGLKGAKEREREKCAFMVPSTSYLGRVIIVEDLHTAESKVKAVEEAPVPCDVTLRSFLIICKISPKPRNRIVTILPPTVADGRRKHFVMSETYGSQTKFQCIQR